MRQSVEGRLIDRHEAERSVEGQGREILCGRLDLDQLDTAFWSDVERIVTGGDPFARRRLERLRLAERRGVRTSRHQYQLRRQRPVGKPGFCPGRAGARRGDADARA